MEIYPDPVTKHTSPMPSEAAWLFLGSMVIACAASIATYVMGGMQDGWLGIPSALFVGVLTGLVLGWIVAAALALFHWLWEDHRAVCFVLVGGAVFVAGLLVGHAL